VTISSLVGYCKPDPEIYTIVKRKLNNQGNTLFIDDQEKNFKQAKVLGWNTLLADENGDWVDRILPFLFHINESNM
jgi:HAD superfamily hydrolase (TIGR01509 family)